MAAPLPRPGVEVIQVFSTTSPTVVTPTLVPCIVGVCKQTVELYVTTSTGGRALNNEALLVLPAVLETMAATGSPPAFMGLNGLDLVLSINNGPDVTITFEDLSGLGLTPASLAAQIIDQFVELGVTEATAGYTADHTVYIRTVGTGDTQTLEVMTGTAAAVLSAFGGAAYGWAIGRSDEGVTSYRQYQMDIEYFSLPDPKGNLDELVIESDTVRAFLAGGGGSSNIREFMRTEALLRHGAGSTAATLTSLTNIILPVVAGVMTVALDGTDYAIDIAGAADIDTIVDQLNQDMGDFIFSKTTGPKLVITSKTTGPTSTIEITAGLTGTLAADLGFASPNNTATGTAAVVSVDDSDGDSTTPVIRCTGVDFTASATAAAKQGLYDVSAVLASLIGTTLILSVNGKPPQTKTFIAADTADMTHLCDSINEFFSGLLVTGADKLTFTSTVSGEESSISFIGGTALPIMGFVPYLVGRVEGADMDLTAIPTKTLAVNVSGTVVTHTFGAGPFADMAAVVADLEADMTFAAKVKSTVAATAKLHLAAKEGGRDAYIKIVTSTSFWRFGFQLNEMATCSVFYGTAFKPISGDDLYVDGILIGRILKVAYAGNDTLKLDKEVTVDSTFGDSFFIIAKNLPAVSGRPTPELTVDAKGNCVLCPNVIRDTMGNPSPFVAASVYVAYRALRMDVTAKAANPSLLRFESTTQLEDTIPPVTTENPLALGVYFAILNAPSCTITALGIDEVTEDAPYGTVDAFTRAAEFLEAYEVYAIAPLVHEETVAQVFSTHVTMMSEPENKGERICLFNFDQPTRKVHTLVASSTEGNSVTGTGGLQFDTGVANLAALLLAQGVQSTGTIPTSEGVFLDLLSDDKAYSIQSISGSRITLRVAFAPGDNDDGFYSTTPLDESEGPLVGETFAIRIRGAALVDTTGAVDRQGVADTISLRAQSYKNRRFWSIVPAQAAAVLDGVEQTVEGFYLCAAIAGMIGQQPPQQSFTNFPMTGFSRVIGSNDMFTEKQLNNIAGGGNYIVVQEVKGAPLISRMALTTDITSVETRTDSINKIVDYTAKFLRTGLKNFIGQFNITSSLIDTLSHVVQGLTTFLADTGVLIGAQINSVAQDENNPDTVLIDVTLDVPYPCNYIRLTLVI